MPIMPAVVVVALYALFVRSLFNPINLDKSISFRPYVFIFLGIFALQLLSLFYTENLYEGLKRIESQICFFFFAIFIMRERNRKESYTYYFSLSSAITVVFLLTHSSYQYYLELLPDFWPGSKVGINNFFTDRFSFILHPSYFSMYLAFALSYVLIQWRKQGFLWTYLLQSVFLTAGIFCCNSVMGNVVGLLIGIVFLLSFLISADLFFKYTPKFLIFIALMCMLGLLLKKEDLYADFNSYYAQIDKTTTSSIPARVLIWKTGLELIPQSGFLGVGIGDVKDVLTQAYQAKGYTGCFEHQFNAHNQFLQTTLAVGFPGLLTLLGMLLVPFYQWWKQRNLLGIALIGIVFMNLLVESMFERQAGSIFFVFAALFMVGDLKETNQSKKDMQESF